MNFIKTFLFAALVVVPGVSLAQTATSTPEAPTAPSYSCIELTQPMTLNSTDTGRLGDVTRLQAFLVAAGYLKEEPSGYFKWTTREALQKFQREVMGMTKNTPGFGQAGPVTRAKIKEVSCANPTNTILGLVTAEFLASGQNKFATSGAFAVPLDTLRFYATNESVNLYQIGLKINLKDVSKISVWDEAKQVATKNKFDRTNAQQNITFNLSSGITIPAGGYKDLVLKVDILPYGGTSNHNIYAAEINESDTLGVGIVSGKSIVGSDRDAKFSQITYYFKSLPTFSLDAKAPLRLEQGELMKFKVRAHAKGSVSLRKITFGLAPSNGATVRSANLQVYTDPRFSNPISGFENGRVLSTDVQVGPDGKVVIYPDRSIVVPTGSTYYFKLLGSLDTTPGATVTTTLLGNVSSRSSLFTLSDPTFSASNLVWSPNENGVAQDSGSDWAYTSLPSIPEEGLKQTSVRAESASVQGASVIDAFSVETPAESEPAPASMITHTWNNNLQIGSMNIDDVSALQSALSEEGLFSGEITGGFYNQTYLAVKAFQAKYGIESTGFVGPVTREKLNSLYRGSN